MLVSIALVVIAILVSWLYSRQSLWSKLGIAEIPRALIFGNIFPVLAKRKPYFQLQEDLYNYDREKPYIGYHQFSKPFLLVRDPELLKKMLRETRNFDDHGLFADPSDPLSMNLFYFKGEQWKRTRSRLRQPFSTSGMKMTYTDVQQCVDNFLNGFNGWINLRPAMDSITSKVFAKALFAMDNDEDITKAATKVFDLTGFSAFRVFVRTIFPKIALKLGLKTAPQQLEDIFRDALRKSKRRPGSFLDLMFQLKEKYPDFDDDMLLGQFFIFILAGFETTSTALTFCLFLLAKHPEAQKKARKEIEEVTLKHGTSFESLKEMVYLDYVLNETMRLYTPLSSVLRISEHPYKLPCGAVLPAGTAITVPYMGLHRDPQYFERPLDFIPERWASRTKPVFFYPFGLGPRVCIGMTFAVLEMKTFLSTLLLRREIQMDPANNKPLEFEPNSVFIHPKHPLYVNIKPLSNYNEE